MTPPELVARMNTGNELRLVYSPQFSIIVQLGRHARSAVMLTLPVVGPVEEPAHHLVLERSFYYIKVSYIRNSRSGNNYHYTKPNKNTNTLAKQHHSEKYSEDNF